MNTKRTETTAGDASGKLFDIRTSDSNDNNNNTNNNNDRRLTGSETAPNVKMAAIITAAALDSV